MTLVPTPGQTVGPFFHFSLPYDGDSDLVPAGHPGRIRLEGMVRDGDGAPVPDALIELWQPDSEGRVLQAEGSLRRDGFTFTGWGRAATDRTGRYSFSTCAPGPVTAGAPAFFAVCVFARGLPDRLLTRAYLPDDTAALVADPVLASLPPERRSTLVAGRDEHGYVFDICLQGENETVFFQHR